MANIIRQDVIEKRIFLIRGQNVMLDSSLAELYGVETKVLNQAVKRNRKRFPKDFMFRLTKEESRNLRRQNDISIPRSQFVTLKTGRGRHRKYLPYVFTEQGVAMLSSVLNKVNNKFLSLYKDLKKELKSDKVKLEIRGIVDKKVSSSIHDRWIISEGLCCNVPSTDTVARGQYTEVKQSNNFPQFDKWWRKSKDIEKV